MAESLPFAVIDYPAIDPVLVEIFGLPIRWYSLAYLGGLILGWLWMRRMVPVLKTPVSRADLDDYLLWATFGVILGGRLGYVLFYKPLFFAANPLAILQLWDGGMSFHGGMLGTLIATVLFCRRRSIPIFRFADMLVCAVPIGLFLGRIANFINGELWGRPTDVAWAMIFPSDPAQVPRHPSQLYEAGLEGLLLFILLNALAFKSRLGTDRPGTTTGIFFIGYGLARYIVEFARAPDAHLGLIGEFISMGQILSLPMLAIGLWFLWQAGRRAPSHLPSGSRP